MAKKAKKKRLIKKPPARSKVKKPTSVRPVALNLANYEVRKESARERNAAISLSGRDIGDLPPVADPARKAACAVDFHRFCTTYFGETFDLPMSKDHLKVIAKVERSVLKGGLFAVAMPRGSGKTSIAEVAVLWATLYGHRAFVALIGASEDHASEMLDSIKTELETNDLLGDDCAGDFPEVCYPIRCLDGISNRAPGQLHKGKRTYIGWTADEVILPSIEGSAASGAIIKVAGITGRIRGMKFKRTDGKTVRPSLVIIDDPQTDESAKSPTQCAGREGTLAGAILGLAGPGKKISGIMPCTVICPGDMADRILDREKHPEWNGERTKMIYSWPTNRELWKQYAEIRADSLRANGTGSEATDFYAKNRADMDSGAVAAWAERFNYDELSALQHAMNLRYERGDAAFFAEYQNEPLLEDLLPGELTSSQIASKLNRFTRGRVPLDASHLTAFIDVQQNLLFYTVCGWSDGFTGYVLDYGSYPDQRRAYFSLRDASRTLADVAPAAGFEGTIYAGLELLAAKLTKTEWIRDDGAALRINRILIDANWGQSTEVVYQFCRQSEHAALLMPSHGRYVGAATRPFHEWTKRPGERVGLNWRVPIAQNKRSVRHVTFDANWWKSFIHARLAVPMGDRGCLSLWGDNPDSHRLFADHLTAEYRVRTQGRGRTCDEWKLRVEKPDNHWFDCMVGAAVAASMVGCTLAETTQAKPATSAARPTARQLLEASRR